MCMCLFFYSLFFVVSVGPCWLREILDVGYACVCSPRVMDKTYYTWYYIDRYFDGQTVVIWYRIWIALADAVGRIGYPGTTTTWKAGKKGYSSRRYKKKNQNKMYIYVQKKNTEIQTLVDVFVGRVTKSFLHII